MSILVRSLLVAIALLGLAASTSRMAAEEPSGDWKIPADRETFHIFLLLGQSNMAGFAELEKGDDQPVPHILMLRGELTGPNTKELADKIEWLPGAHRLHRVQDSGRFGLGMDFAKEYLKLNPGVTVGLIPCAWGGSPIDDLNKGTNRYANTIERGKFAQQSGVLKGILWHQGESDSVTLAAANAYAGKLDKLIADLRSDLGDEKLPFVVGALAPEYGQGRAGEHSQGIPIVQKVLATLPERTPHTAFAPATDLKTAGDGFVHFDRTSYSEFGRRYARALIDLREKAEAKQAPTK